MAQVEVRDRVMWTRHIHGDVGLQDALNELSAETTTTLRVAGELGVWRKMRANVTTGAPTPGLRPIGPAAIRWRELYKAAKAEGGAVVDIELAQSAPVSEQAEHEAPSLAWERASPQEQRAAWAAIKRLWDAGWRSDAPYGPRDELYERDDKP
jgi:hypothetical protein